MIAFAADDALDQIRAGVRDVCAKFPDRYWRDLEPDRYPDAFVRALTEKGWLAALIPEEHGGAGLALSAAAAIMEEISASGANAAACHAQMYLMSVLVRHGTREQQRRYLPEIAAGRLRLQALGLTEPTAGSDVTRITTRAVRTGDGYTISGQKVFTSRAEHSDLMVLLARTAKRDEERSYDGLSLFLIDLRDAGGSIEIRSMPTMINHSTTEVFIDELHVGEEARIGQEGRGLRCLFDGLNAERILIASECIGDGRWLLERGAEYAKRRVVFGRPIGANQGVAFPLAGAYAALSGAAAVRDRAAALFEAGRKCVTEANTAKLLASEASWRAANACLDVHGGYGFAIEYDVQRKFRETRLYLTAPIANNLVLAHLAHTALGLPRSY